MPQINASYVVDLSLGDVHLFEGSTADCRAWIDKRAVRQKERLALVTSAVRSDEGTDAVLCVPLSAVGRWEVWEAQAAAIVARWEQTWLLIDSMPLRYRDDARAGLHNAIAAALADAAIAGFVRDDDDF